jgi:NAD(P)-dependent dehydrogenase (short-subunit alcohol dehydrogenase family)
MTGRFAGRVALVTGAARNIGRAIAERLSDEGARVALADIDEAVDAAAAAITARGGDAAGYRIDVSSGDDVDACFDAVIERFGTVDILVNNAAVVRAGVRHFLQGDEKWWDAVLGVNLKGQFLCARRAAALMAANGRGVIVNISSGGATRAHRGMAAYDASKGGSEALTRALALDLAPYGIRVAAIVPGLIVQEGQAEESVALAAATVPLTRMGEPRDVAAAVAFVASDDAAYITGAVIVVDGGLLAQQRSPQVETFPVSSFPLSARNQGRRT